VDLRLIRRLSRYFETEIPKTRMIQIMVISGKKMHDNSVGKRYPLFINFKYFTNLSHFSSLLLEIPVTIRLKISKNHIIES